MAESQENRAVLVTNISPSANEKTVSDFFSFCGKIIELFLKKEEGKDTSSAVITFETESAAKTALLLTNALIVDRPITVSSYVTSSTPAETTTTTQSTTVTEDPRGTPVDQSNIINKDFNGIPDADRSKTSVVASLLAAGYTLANNALENAKEIDERNNFSARARVVVNQMVVKAQEIDKELGISDKANAAIAAVKDTANKVDAQYGISEKTASAVATIKTGAQIGLDAAQSGIAKAQENATVKKGVEVVKSGVSKAEKAINDLTIQTRNEIEHERTIKTSSSTEEGPSTQTM